MEYDRGSQDVGVLGGCSYWQGRGGVYCGFEIYSPFVFLQRLFYRLLAS